MNIITVIIYMALVFYFHTSHIFVSEKLTRTDIGFRFSLFPSTPCLNNIILCCNFQYNTSVFQGLLRSTEGIGVQFVA